MQIKLTQKEIDKLLNDISEEIESGDGRYPGMNYEQGVDAAIRWITGESDEHPYED